MPDSAAVKALAQEIALVDHIERLQKFRAGRVAVLIRLSRLSDANRRADYIRLATELFERNVTALSGKLFALHNHDLVFVTDDPPGSALDKAADRVSVLFSEDPIFAAKDAGEESFCARYALDRDYDRFLKTAKDLLHEAEQDLADYNRKDPKEALTPIRPELLGRLEQTLAKTDLTGVSRRQAVCTLIEDQPPQMLFEEIYISIGDLQRAATPGVDLLADPWLFQYLAGTLDKRMMALLTKEGAAGDRPFSINLNVASVLTPDFLRFDEAVSAKLRGKLVVEFNKLDVFADMGMFLFARDFLRERGYRLCLDGLTCQTLPYCDRTRLGFDLIKLRWTPDSLDDLHKGLLPQIRDLVTEAGRARTILCRCENLRAVEIGKELGIVMFQGRYIDRIATAARGNTAAAFGR